jgi:hypothetical protein
MRKEAMFACFKALFWHLPGATEENPPAEMQT